MDKRDDYWAFRAYQPGDGAFESALDIMHDWALDIDTIRSMYLQVREVQAQRDENLEQLFRKAWLPPEPKPEELPF